MPDESPEDLNAREAAAEAQVLAAMNAGSGGPGRPRLVRLLLAAGASFLLAGLLALVLGGHFRRSPLNKLRGVPLLGQLIPAPAAPQPAPEPEKLPTIEDRHPMPAAELNQLIQGLQKARDDFRTRQVELQRDEERLRLLQADLQRERDRLDELMATLSKRQAELDTERQALDAQTIVSKAEERRRLAQLARIYEAQAPASAAIELATLDRANREQHLAAKVFAEMQEKKAAAIFDSMKPEIAVALKGQLLQVRSERDLEAKKEERP